MDNIVLTIDNVKVLADSTPVTFDVEVGEVVCLFGMNGSGKTLLLKSICEIFTPLSGTITQYIDNKSRGVCLQFPEHLVFKSTVQEEAELITGSIDGAKLLIEELGVSCDGSPFFLSDGEKRLLFLYGYLQSKQFCLFDEPFASLDSATKQLVGDKIQRSSKAGKTIIYTANRKSDLAYADKVIDISRI